MFATGKAGHKPVRSAADKRLKDFRAKLNDLLEDLACQVARDGEGASKFITIDVSGAASDAAARRIGLAVANSPLVKTAIAGEDANWGRIVMAIGKAGEKANRDRLKIAIGGVTIAEKGQRRAGYDETPVVQHMKGQRDRHRLRCRRRQGPRPRLVLRSDPRLYRHQRQLPQLAAAGLRRQRRQAIFRT